jgi:hypothetical protein
MTGDDVVVLADQDRVGKSECADAASNLRDLRVGVRASIPRRGNQPLDRSVLESQVIASLICSGSLLISCFHLVAGLPPTLNFAAIFQCFRRSATAYEQKKFSEYRGDIRGAATEITGRLQEQQPKLAG